ncbi:hypothetical protein WJX74_010161 [Apatococcus lobatus]|uniref:Kinesin-like protein n=1 Tax=Apatococcus lobatus TaxID=904363 RepID=A0AAW1RM05_9CHLO
MKVAQPVGLPPAFASGDLKEAVNAYSQAVKELEATAAREQEEEQEASASGDNFKVVIRIRPPLPREYQGISPYQNAVFVDSSSRVLTLSENLRALLANGAGVDDDGLTYSTYRFAFDHVYQQDSLQTQVYDRSARGAVLSTLQGYNAAIIAYGQTGTGKTFTMEGGSDTVSQGIIPRAIEDMFSSIEHDCAPRSKYLVRASYLQIYNEVISDLLKPERQNLTIREDRKRGVYVEGLSEWVVRTPGEVYGLMQRGAAERAVGATKLNELSSRSHAVFIIIVEKSSVLAEDTGRAETAEMAQLSGNMPGMGRQAPAPAVNGEVRQSVKVGKLNLVDLAGSERVHITGATGKRLEESKKINQSLSALGNVIAALTESRNRSHIPYRDSKLTRILEDSLGGNCKTTMIAMISPALESFNETVGTLKFANRAKNIKNLAKVNEDVDQRTLLRKYERELRRLRAELQRRQRELVDKRHLLEAEEQKRRAEADKLAAITALEQRSREFMLEKEEKRRLEVRISSLQSQLLVGGNKPEDTPVFRTLLAREHQRIRGEYEERLRELEAERDTTAEDRLQADRFQQLLLQQRDIMIALTARLNQRDEQLMTLQQEVEAYDAHQQQLEDMLDQRTAELIALRKAAVEHSIASPSKFATMQSALGPWGQREQNGSLETPKSNLSRTASQQLHHMADDSAPSTPIAAAHPQESPHSAASHVQEVQEEHAAQLQTMQQAFEDFQSTSKQQLRVQEALIHQLQADNERLASSQEVGSQTGEEEVAELAELRERCSDQAKEREALHTILDAKIRALVKDVAHSIQAIPNQAQQYPRLSRQVSTLDKLVEATVSAMSAGSSADH